MSMIWWIVIGVALMLGSYVVYILVSAYYEVKASPREPMFECEIHGMFRRAHLINFLGVDYCPMCFDKKLHTKKLDETIG